MKVFKSNSKTVFVATDREGQCPRSIITARTIKMGDDYHGKIRFSKKFAQKLGF